MRLFVTYQRHFIIIKDSKRITIYLKYIALLKYASFQIIFGTLKIAAT